MQRKANVITFIFIHYIGALTLSTSLVSSASISVLAFQAMPYLLAQITVALAWSAGIVALILSSAVSVFKILLVTHFEAVFSQDPEIFGKKVVLASLLIGCLPPCLVSMYQSAHGILSTSYVSFLTEEPHTKNMSLTIPIYGISWFIINLSTFTGALLFIPFYIDRNHKGLLTAEFIQKNEEAKNIKFGRMIFSFILAVIGCPVAVITYGQPVDKGLPVQAVITILVCTSILLFYVFDKDLWDYWRRKVFPSCDALKLRLTMIFFNKLTFLRNRRIHPVLEINHA